MVSSVSVSGFVVGILACFERGVADLMLGMGFDAACKPFTGCLCSIWLVLPLLGLKIIGIGFKWHKCGGIEQAGLLILIEGVMRAGRRSRHGLSGL